MLGTKGAPTTRTGAWSTRRSGRFSGEDGGAALEAKAGLLLSAVLPVADAGSSKAAAPATATLNSVTPASRTMLQSSSRIRMRRKQGMQRVVPRAPIVLSGGWNQI